MRILRAILVLFAQIFAAQLLGFVAALALGIGNGWEIVWFALADAAAIWGVGAAAARWQGGFELPAMLRRLAGTAIGAVIGALVLALPWAVLGFAGILLPLGGALLGYYLTPLVRRP